MFLGVSADDWIRCVVLCFMFMAAVVGLLAFVSLVKTNVCEVEHWTEVHKRNQDNIRRDQLKAFEAQLVIPDQFRARRSKGENDVES